jgi:anaerobic selenocysteine-containing dehydrogenase
MLTKMNAKVGLNEEYIPTLCRQCDMHCGIVIHLIDGAPKDVSGLATHPTSRGFICEKGKAAIDWITHPDRIRKPLKRKNDGTFIEIPYTDALNEIAGKMLQIKGEYGPAAMGVWIGEALGFLQQPDYARRFIHAFGSPNFFSADSVCFSAVYMAYHLVKGYWGSFPDFENSKLILLWGTNPKISYPPYMNAIERAKKKGATLVVIDPRISDTAKRADVFIQLRPGTDGALAWGLARYLIEHNLYNHHFVSTHSSGFPAFAQHARKYSPEVVSGQCGVHKDSIAIVAHLMAEAKPAVAQLTGISLEQQVNGVNTIRIIASLSGLCGAEDAKGGELWPKVMNRNSLSISCRVPPSEKNPIGADTFPLLYDLCCQCHSLTAIDNMLGSDGYPLRGLIVSGANPILTNPNSDKVEKAFSSLDLLVSRELFHTKTSDCAHYIVPGSSFLERSELYFYADHQRVGISNKVITIPGINDEYTFWRDLSGLLGFKKKYFPWKDEDEVNRFILEPSGIKLEDLKQTPAGIIHNTVRYKKYRFESFPTPSGTYEFSCQYASSSGIPEIPEYNAPRYIDHPDPEYPFICITGVRKRFIFNSRYHNLPRLNERISEPAVEMNPEDARKLNLKNEDRVMVATRIGKIELRVHVLGEGEILQGVVQITHGWDEANVNKLVDDSNVDPISGFPDMKTIPVKIDPIGKALPADN